jgi:membrane protein implicated in regulation of membrane protease activity
MIQLKSPNLLAKAFAPFAQIMSSMAFGKTISGTQPVLAVDLTENFEKEAIVEEEIRPHSVGRIHFQATSWPARCKQEVILVPGQTVRVVGIDNITQLVEPLE